VFPIETGSSYLLKISPLRDPFFPGRLVRESLLRTNVSQRELTHGRQSQGASSLFSNVVDLPLAYDSASSSECLNTTSPLAEIVLSPRSLRVLCTFGSGCAVFLNVVVPPQTPSYPVLSECNALRKKEIPFFPQGEVC